MQCGWSVAFLFIGRCITDKEMGYTGTLFSVKVARTLKVNVFFHQLVKPNKSKAV